MHGQPHQICMRQTGKNNSLTISFVRSGRPQWRSRLPQDRCHGIWYL